MSKRNKKCYLCGATYKYCPTCGNDRMKPSWMNEFHSEDCKNIFQICTNFNLNMMSKHEAQEALKACDLSNKANFKSFVQCDLENIFKEDEEPKLKRSKRAEIKLAEEVAEIHEVVEE